MTFTVINEDSQNPSPVSGTVKKGTSVISVQIPTDETGKLVAGGMTEQAKQCFKNLEEAMIAAGGSLSDVMFVTIYITDKADWQAMHDVWCATFKAPFPGRATIGCKELMLEGMLIEIIANADIG